MVHAPQVHQLVDEDVFAHSRRHQNEPPVQADVTLAAAGAPARALIADADARDGDTETAGERQKSRRQLAARSIVQGAPLFERAALASQPRTLAGDPSSMAASERFGLAS